jgi:3-isopropylmalate/(R)-2-methylmalate dehydratase small subunit
MEPFTRLNSPAVPIARPNVDTDQLLPARFLQKPRADDFGAYLFRDLRTLPDGTANPLFPIDAEACRGAAILVAGRNFGCGSSREHAVWALVDHGFRAAVAPSFGDIFRSNALKNGLLPIVMPEEVVARMLAFLEAAPGAAMTVDLESQTVRGPHDENHGFAIERFAKECLLEGLDELAYTLRQIDAIAAFEARYGAAP